MSIKIGYDFNKNELLKDKDLTINQKEKDLLEQIINAIIDEFIISDFNIVKNCNDYSTLQYKQRDLVRIKYTNNSKWISLLMVDKKCKEDNINNPIFENEKNKNKLHWKSLLNNDDIHVYIPLIIKNCEYINNLDD